MVVYCLTTAAAVVGLTTALLWSAAPTTSQLVLFVALAALGVLQAELGRHVERARRRLSGGPHVTMSSVWTFAAVLVLPPGLAGALTAILYLHLGLRSWYRLRRVPPFRTINNACCVILSCYAAAAVLFASGIDDMHSAIQSGWPGVLAVLGAMLAQFGVNAVAILPARNEIGRTPHELFGDWADNGLDLATLCVGVLNAVTLTTLPGLIVVALPLILLMHRVVLVGQLEAAVTRDEKTGVLSHTGWRAKAEGALIQVERKQADLGLLMIDLDHFKKVNDTYGHPAGDVILREAATAITRCVRDSNDAVGRFGGEEFVVALPNVSARTLGIIAERIRHEITQLAVPIQANGHPMVITGLSASIGASTWPHAASTLDALIASADVALYHAKDEGRNRVVQSQGSAG
ncbi:diguanylate cyclase (GGDEF)-like protein [Herbihabitans rhizosphaerae]|uniref:Diguanylate cyclase (GGDEF)-like protein n=1 Tax=Herbihabitans rhizosphaerae TaxID=1872711 RepID=A0A4Q7KRD8_9PSEU|nr:GGDEF domain-containing protein [Herbihabitans rhizosphaerae]RZS39115.1 diguanylate cyclase (GGDEF)-like protein [Herbihabitans rhizosphaerae]